MKTLSRSLTDPQFTKPASYSWFNRKMLALIRDERDLPFIALMLKCTFTLIPLAIIMYVVPVGNIYWWTAAALYFIVSNFMFKGPFGLMLHCTSHRVLFKKEYGILNN